MKQCWWPLLLLLFVEEEEKRIFFSKTKVDDARKNVNTKHFNWNSIIKVAVFRLFIAGKTAKK